MMKNKQEPSHPPVVVAIPNTTQQKMEAILALARSNESLARALESVNVNVRLEHLNISNTHTGVRIGLQEKEPA